MYRRVLTAIFPFAVAARAVAAQVSSGSVDLGTAVLSQPTIGSSSVLTAAGAYSFVASRGELAANGIAARTPNDLYTGQGVVTAARYAPPLQLVRWELAATASGFGVSGLSPSFGWQLLAREHVGTSESGGFAGVTAGSVGQAGVWQRVLGAHVGGFGRFGAQGAEQFSAALSYTDATPPSGFGSSVRYADLFGYWSHTAGSVELLAGGGARARGGGSLGATGWASATATYWMTPRLAVVVAGGRALEDVTRAVPAVRYLTFALRVGQRQATPVVAVIARRPKVDRRQGLLDVRVMDDSTRLLTVRADSASTVELMADFTDWEPVMMTRLPNGTWRLERVMTPGVHHVAIRIDGGSWLVPPNLTRAPDEFGGEVGLLAVP